MEGPREVHKDTCVHPLMHTLLTHQARHTFQKPADAQTVYTQRPLTAQVYGHSERIRTHTRLYKDTWKQPKTQTQRLEKTTYLSWNTTMLIHSLIKYTIGSPIPFLFLSSHVLLISVHIHMYMHT